MSDRRITREQAELPVNLAIKTNTNNKVGRTEAVDKASQIKSAAYTDSQNAYLVTNISLTSKGAATPAVITPKMSGLAVQYTVSGTDG
jgi:hypothetical protein